MKKIAVVALLYVTAVLPAYADEDSAYAFPEADEDAQLPAIVIALKSEVARLSTFRLLQVGDNFSLYGKLSVPHITAAETGMYPNAATCGLRGQFNSATSRIGIRLGWDRYIAGQNSGDNLYSLTATVRF